MVGDLADTLQDTDGPKKLKCKLVVGTGSDRSLNIRLKLQEFCISNRETLFSTVLDIMGLHTLLSTREVLANRFQDNFALFEKLL